MTRDDGRSSHRGRGVSYFRAIAAVIDVAWDIAAGADLAFPQVPGKRSAKVRLVNAYMPRLHAAAAHDTALAAALVRVIGLKDRPEGLLRPDRVLRVLRGNLADRRRPAPALSDQAPAATPAERPMQPAPLQGKRRPSFARRIHTIHKDHSARGSGRGLFTICNRPRDWAGRAVPRFWSAADSTPITSADCASGRSACPRHDAGRPRKRVELPRAAIRGVVQFYAGGKTAPTTGRARRVADGIAPLGHSDLAASCSSSETMLGTLASHAADRAGSKHSCAQYVKAGLHHVVMQVSGRVP